MSFNEIQEKINKTFEGANVAYLNTAAGKMEAISIATGNFAEIVGGGLVDALIRSSGSSGVEGLVGKIDKLAQSTVNAIEEFEKFAFITRYIFNPKNFDLFGGGEKFTRDLNAFVASQQMAGAAPFDPKNNSVSGYKASEKAAKDAKKLAEQQAKLLKLSITNQKKLTEEQKKQAALKKAGSIFDLEQVQLIAALKGKLSDEDRKRVELQFALLTGNTKQVQTLTYEIARAQGLSEDLAKHLADLPPAKNPFAAWDAYLDKILEKAQRAANTTSTTNTAVAVSTIVNKSNVSDPSLAEYGQSLVKNNVFDRPTTVPSMPATNVAKLPSTGNLSQFGAGPYLFPSSSQSNIVVQIDGKAVASALQDSSLSGIGSSVNRTGR
jgi:hypothetical protein